MKKLLTITIAIILAMPTKMVPGTIYGARHHLCLRPMAKGVSEETLTADLVDAAELAAIQEQVQQLLAEWDEIFPKQIEAEPASREGSDIFEQDKRVRQAAAPFDDSEWIARGDDKIIEKFFEAHKYEILPIEKRRNITVKYIRQLLEKLHKPWKQIEMDPEDIRDRRGEKIEHPSEKRIATVRHLRQRQHDVTVFDKKVSMLRNLADAKLDTKVKLNLVLNDMIKILKDNAEALFSEQIEEDRIFQYVIRIYVRWVISAIIDYDPIKVSDALMPLLKSEGHQGRKENIETLLLQCIVSMQQKDASLDEQVKVARAIREAEKDSKPLDFLDEMRPVNKLKEIMPKIKIIIDTQWVEGLLEIEAGSTVKDVLLSLGIPVGGEQMIDVIRHGRSVLGARPGRMDVLKKELLRGDNLVVLSEIKAEPENIIKILETTGIIKPDTFQEETQREGLALTVAALGEASFGLLRRMKGMRYRVYKDYDYHIESVDMANIFSELIHRIKRNVGISEAILFLRDFVLQDAEKEGIPRLQNLLAVPFTDDFLKGFLAVLERKDGYEKVCKILSLDIKRYGVPEHEEPSEREALHAEAPETELVFRAIAQKQRQLPKAEFGRWLERYLEHIEIGLWVR